jgi:hypothetical protein
VKTVDFEALVSVVGLGKTVVVCVTVDVAPSGKTWYCSGGLAGRTIACQYRANGGVLASK